MLIADEMPRFLEVVPDGLGAAKLISAAGGWEVVARTGDVESDWALEVLRAGEARLYADTDDESDEVEAVIRRGDVHVVVANPRCAVVLRVSNGSNLGLALAYAHQQVREVTA